MLVEELVSVREPCAPTKNDRPEIDDMNAGRSGSGVLFAGRPFAQSVVDRVNGMVATIGESTIRTTKSQIAFRRRRGFAYLWPPPLGDRSVEIVLSIALSRHDASPRFKQVGHPAPHVWMHHLEIRELAQLDDQVVAWLREAFVDAS